jgi:hypothetical protein
MTKKPQPAELGRGCAFRCPMSPMNPVDKFLRFAAECEAMVKLARSREGKDMWRGLAARWVRYAELIERQSATARDRIAKRHRLQSRD